MTFARLGSIPAAGSLALASGTFTNSDLGRRPPSPGYFLVAPETREGPKGR